jgi:signal transduction histidine kinase
MPAHQQHKAPWTLLAYVLVCAPLLLLLGACLWAAYRDVQMVRNLTLRAHVNRLRSQAIRRASRLEAMIERHAATPPTWTVLREAPWFNEFWSAIEMPAEQLYAAVVDEAGVIAMHSDPSRMGKRLGGGWYERRVPEAGEDVVRLEGQSLAGAAQAYDVTVPLYAASHWIGDYHEGLDARWFDSTVLAEQRRVLANWGWITALVAVVDGAAVWAVVYLMRHRRALDDFIRSSRQERLRELAQLGSGLAHEIRNPLHALRINLHLLRRGLSGRSALNESQLAATIQDSDAAIDRLGGLMNDLLQFADPHRGKPAEIDLSREVQATLNLLEEELRLNQIEVRAQLTPDSAAVVIEPARLRQLVLNLLTFAQHKSGQQGSIEVEVSRRGEQVELSVADSGAALTEEQQSRVFEPFQAPAETGSGLGLALVRVYAEEAGGGVACEHRAPSGNRFRLWLPHISSVASGGKL